jgi:DNA-binding transcriptional LysR family regulator
MNINALLAFRTVVLDGSASAAAARMNLSQPAVSRLISQLEHELKLPLFHRRGRRLVVTEEGRAFFHDADRILGALGQIPAIAAGIRLGLPKSLQLVVMPRVAHGWVAPAIARFHADNPATLLGIDVLRRNDMESWLAVRQYDLGIGALPARHADIDTVPMLRARACAFVAPGHPLAKRRKVSPSQLVRHRLIGLTKGLLPRDQVDDIFRSEGIVADYVIETTATSLACSMAAHGIGVTITDPLSASGDVNNLVAIPIHPAKWMTFGLLVRRNAQIDPLAAQLIDCLRVVGRSLARSPLFELSV